MPNAQMKANTEKANENRQKEAKRQDKRNEKAAVIIETGRSLVLLKTKDDGLNVKELNRQLDYHREAE
ncbi:hypothetical protein BDN70DRAFT_888880 [Pholiota conissans]|uniref:Uncharacterized protein n=1 Tax=Pholiota conissans TaxID=109636 RepID=A0A9P5YJX8_9AGAR|nr:hypothetical protein BDN70DRAFT_888880 [Pholiota conissans]